MSTTISLSVLYKMLDGLCSLSRLVTVLKSCMIENHVDCSVAGKICRVAKRCVLFTVCVYAVIFCSQYAIFPKKKGLLCQTSPSIQLFLSCCWLFHTKLLYQTQNAMCILEILSAHQGKRNHQYQNIRTKLPNFNADIFLN
jgi:hypothetical protein